MISCRHCELGEDGPWFAWDNAVSEVEGGRCHHDANIIAIVEVGPALSHFLVSMTVCNLANALAAVKLSREGHTFVPDITVPQLEKARLSLQGSLKHG